jgi:hypothetical protein
MRTIGMMGEVVGKAAYLAVRENTDPRGVYQKHLPELLQLLEQPGRMRRADLRAPLVLDESIADFKQLPVGSMNRDLGRPAGAAPKLGAEEKAELAKLPGLVVDDAEAKFKGRWTPGESLAHVGAGYHYAPKGDNEADYTFEIPKTGRYEVRVYWAGHENRASNATVTLDPTGDKAVSIAINQKTPTEGGFHALGTYEFLAGRRTVTIGAIDVGWFSGVVVRDVVIDDPAHGTRIEASASAKQGLWALATGGIAGLDATVAANVRTKRMADGSLGIQSLAKAAGAPAAQSSAPAPAAPFRLPAGLDVQLTVSKLDFQVDAAGGGIEGSGPSA